jgi:hypothetical protein
VTETPIPVPVDLFTWLRDFHGIREHDTPDSRPVNWPARQTATIHAVACAIAASVYGKTGEAKLGIPRIAERAQVSKSTVSNVLPYLEDAGWLRITRTTKPGTKGNMPNLYELTSPVAALRTAVADQGEQTYPVQRGRVPRSAGEGTPLSGYELRTELRDTTTKDEKTSVAALPDPVDDLRRRGEETPDPMPLHPEWSPNNSNRKIAAELGVEVEVLAQVFRASEIAVFENRRRWGAAFSEFMRAQDEGVSGNTFGITDDDVATVVVDAAVDQLRDANPQDVEVIPTPSLPDPVDVVEDQDQDVEEIVSPPVVLDFTPRSLVADLNWLARVVGVVTPLRTSERAEAERLLTAGESRESVKSTILGVRKAKRAMLERSTPRRTPVPIPA